MPQRQRNGHAYRQACKELKARGDIQPCWSCHKQLSAALPKGHPNSITLGHYTALEDEGALLDPNNYGPQCPACNYSDGARRTNLKRANKTNQTSYTGNYS